MSEDVPNLTGTRYRHTNPRGHAPWKAHAKTQAVLEDVQDVLAELVPKFGAQGNRGIAYRLTERGYDKSDSHFNKIDDISNRGRRSGVIDWDDIYDRSFTTVGDDGFDSPDDFREHIWGLARNYRRDRQENQPVQKLLWVEAAGMLGMVNKFARPFGVPVVSGGGADSTSGKRRKAIEIAANNGLTRVGVIADHDVHGLMIADARTEDITTFVNELCERFVRSNGDRFEGEVQWQWLGVRPDQIDTYGLPSKPHKAGKQVVGDNIEARLRTVQAEAMHPDLWRRIVRGFIAEDFDPDAYRASRRLERAERNRIVPPVEALDFGAMS